MVTNRKKNRLHDWLKELDKKKLARLKRKIERKEKALNLKTKLQNMSHSLLWVWEFSKKAVLICFIFYIIVQVYSMIVMVYSCDFTHLGTLIEKTGEIVENCVFAYLIKAGIENVGKICFKDKPEG